MDYVNRKGEEIDLMTWARHFGDWDYKVVAEDRFSWAPPLPRETWRVITVWEGIIVPAIGRDAFSTGVFRTRIVENGFETELVMECPHPTEEAALTAHRWLVNQLEAGVLRRRGLP